MKIQEALSLSIFLKSYLILNNLKDAAEVYNTR